MEIDDDFIAKLDELNKLYADSKKAIILLENYNPEHKTFIAPLNEMRNALDHLMKMILNKNNPTQVYEQYRGARSHIRRAGYDAYELLCISHSNYMRDLLKDYNTEDISKGFPRYYDEVRPKIEELKGRTAELREKRQARKQQEEELGEETIDNNSAEYDENTFEYYFAAYEQMAYYNSIINNHIQAITECKAERENKEQIISDLQATIQDSDKKAKKATKKSIVIGAVVTLVFSILSFFASKLF